MLVRKAKISDVRTLQQILAHYAREGKLLARSLSELVLTAGLGAMVLGFTLAVSNQVPCIGWLASGIVGLLGLGAATVTLFGTRPFHPGALAVDPAMPSNPPAPLPPPS